MTFGRQAASANAFAIKARRRKISRQVARTRGMMISYPVVNAVIARTDEQLLADHLAGKAGAFDELVRRYAGELFGFLARFVSNSATADDLVQETLVQVHAAAGSFDSGRAFKPWMYTIAANKARDYLRTRGRKATYSLDTTAGEDGPSGAAGLAAEQMSQAENVEAEETRQAVRKVVDAMPEHLRLILTLGHFQQLPYAEIAEILDIPVGTVKSRLHAAVNHFADAWKKRQSTEVSGRL